MIYLFIPASLEVCSPHPEPPLAVIWSTALVGNDKRELCCLCALRAAVKIRNGCLEGTKRRRACNESGAHTVDWRFLLPGRKIIHYSERMLQGCRSTAQYLDKPADDSVVLLCPARWSFPKTKWRECSRLRAQCEGNSIWCTCSMMHF